MLWCSVGGPTSLGLFLVSSEQPQGRIQASAFTVGKAFALRI